VKKEIEPRRRKEREEKQERRFVFSICRKQIEKTNGFI